MREDKSAFDYLYPNRMQYRRFKATGWDYRSLLKLHETSVVAYDNFLQRRDSDLPPISVPEIVVPANIVAYLTDMALKDFAIGAFLEEEGRL